MLRQIGGMNVLAISGGRVIQADTNTVRLPVACGYAVEVEYVPGSDTYTVRRTYRGRIKASRERVYCDEVGEAAYRASCYRDAF